MIELTFTKAGQDDIVLTENDLFDFNCERACFGTETFELGGVVAKSIYLLIDNNTQRFSRGTFANTRIRLELDGNFYGYYNAELPKRRNGVIELTAYDDMIKLDCEYPDTYAFPQLFSSVYAQSLFEAGIAGAISLDNVINNAVTSNGMISYEYTDYIYANSCRQLVAGMAEWNGGFCSITENGKLQIDKFTTTVSHTFNSSDLTALDYSDETITFTKIKTSQKNKTYEVGTDDGYTLVFANQYISYGLKDSVFETFMTLMYNYYNGFTLTPMTFTLAEPDFTLQLGDRISVYDAEEDFTIYGNISKIVVTGNCSMEITCGGFGNVASGNNYNPTSKSETAQAQTTGSATAKRLQTHTEDGYLETNRYQKIWYDADYANNGRCMYDLLSDYQYYRHANFDNGSMSESMDENNFYRFWNLKDGTGSFQMNPNFFQIGNERGYFQAASDQLYFTYKANGRYGEDSIGFRISPNYCYISGGYGGSNSYFNYLLKISNYLDEHSLSVGNFIFYNDAVDGGSTLKITPFHDLFIEIKNTVIKISDGKIEVTAPNGFFVNGTQIG